MKIDKTLPFSFKWDEIPSEKITGLTGFSSIKTQTFGDIKIRCVEYSKNYIADHWCLKGHIIYVIAGSFQLEHQNSDTHNLSKGMTYISGDDLMPHRLSTETGATVLIID